MADPPANDNFVDATDQSGGPGFDAILINVDATKEPEEPDHAGNAGGASVWTRWTAPSTGTVRVDTCSSEFNTLLGVYTGDAVDDLTTVASNDDTAGCDGGGAGQGSLAWASVTAGTTYWIAVDGFDGAQGQARVRVTPPPSNDNFAAAASLIGVPASAAGTNLAASKEPGEPNHAGNVGGHSVWYSWTAPSTRTIRIDTCGSNFDTLLGVYTGSAVNGLTLVASNDDAQAIGGACSNGAGPLQSKVSFLTTAGTTYRIAVDGFTGGTGNGGPEGNFGLNISAAPPLNDAFADAQVLSGLPVAATGTNIDATKQSGEPSHAGNSGGRSVWYRWTAPSSGQVTIETCNSDFDTILGVYTGTAVNSLSPVASNDDTAGCGIVSGGGNRGSRVSFSATAGITYRIAVDGFNGAQGNVGVRVRPPPPANDNFAAAQLLSGLPTSAAGNNFSATRETGEPNHAGDPGGASVWYRWTAPSSGPVTVRTCGSSFDTVLGVYTGAAVGSLTPVGGNDDSCGTRSRVDFQAVEGTVYRIAVDGKAGAEGTISLNLFTTPPPPAIPSDLATTPTSPANDNSPKLHGTADADSTVSVYTNGDCSGSPAATGTTAEFASPGISVTVPGDSTTQLSARAANLVDDTSQCSSAIQYVEDSTAPDTVIDSPPHGTTGDPTPTFAFHSTEGESTFLCSVDQGTPDFDDCSGAASHTPADALADGDYTFRVKATDSAGNDDSVPATEAFTVDTSGPPVLNPPVMLDVAPPIATITLGPGGRTRDRTPTFGFASNEQGSRFDCRVDNRAWAACSSPHTMPSLSFGRHTFSARATDSAGNVGAPAERSFKVTKKRRKH